MTSRKHLYHLVNSSSSAFMLSFFAFFAMCGMAFVLTNLNPLLFKGDLLLFAILMMIKNVKSWYYEVITESTFSGYHTIMVQSGLKLGFILFMISEIMLFFGFFWAFFHMSLSPDMNLGLVWPPMAMLVMNPLEIPLFNTLLLLLSGFSLTWVHKALVNNLVKDVMDGWIMTLMLGSFFLILQIMEYYESTYSFNDSVYGCTFYMLTGLHGMHVFVGVSFLCMCFKSYLYKHFTTSHHLGFLFAAWYWHFVDMVWMLLFLVVYMWGGGIGTDIDVNVIIESFF